MTRSIMIALACGAALSFGGCANDTLVGLAATEPTAALPAKPQADPACAALATRITAMRSDGVTDRIEAAGKGSSKNVSVNRASLARMAELDRANAEFQTKCSTLPRTAAATAPAPAQTAAAPAPAAAAAQTSR